MHKILWLRPLRPSSEEVESIEKLTNAEVIVCSGTPAASAWKHLIRSVQLILVDLPLPPEIVQEALIAGHESSIAAPVVLYDPDSSLDEELICAPITAFSHITERMPLSQLAAVVGLKLKEAAEAADRASRVKEPWRRLLVGESRPIKILRSLIRLAAPRRSTILITGESGTGKEMVARAIHMASSRAGGNLVAVNCAAIPDSLVESELFGHVKGAFTGAISDRPGRFEQAHRGTIFLDEIGEVPLEMQPKLLRVLQDREIQRIGGSAPIQIDARVIAASNQDLGQAAAEKRFREDLLYRLNVVSIVVPPLRERASDIPVLAEHFVEKACIREGLGVKNLSADAVRRLTSYEWPGNVRQLEHTIEMAVTLSGDRTRLYAGDMQLSALGQNRTPGSLGLGLNGSGPASNGSGLASNGSLNLEQTVGRVEQLLIQEALQYHGGNKKKAASALGIPRTTLLYKLRNAAVCA